MKTVNILWTGGWDSTYRVLSLMNKPVSIQPYYLKGKRKTENFEIQAIETITEDIRNHPNTKCEILDLIQVNISDLPSDFEITKAYYNILKTDRFGSQYEWLARFSKGIKNLEICMHKDDTANFFKKYGELKKEFDDLTGDYYILDHEKSSEDLLKVFGNFCFPILYITKLEMKDWAVKSGLISMMNKTWFCYRPINNEPCGRCNPCNYSINEGMEFRFSKSAMRRYRLNKRIKPFKPSVIFKKVKKQFRILRTRFLQLQTGGH